MSKGKVDLKTQEVDGGIVNPTSGSRSILGYIAHFTRNRDSSREKSDYESDSDKVEAYVNPLNFSKTRKWVITVVAINFTLLASSACTAYTLGYPSMKRDLDCTDTQAVLGLSMYLFGFGFTPLVTSAFSEELGRHPLYLGSISLFLAMHVMVALGPNVAVIAVARLIQGAAGSTGATMVAGTLADIWEPKDRGIPMGLFSVVAFAGNAIGCISAGWIEQNRRLEWKWIQWIWLIIGGVYAVIFLLTMRETRASVLHARSAKRMANAQKGSSLEISKAPLKRSLNELLWISCTRPLVMLFTEPIVLAMSAWLAFAWGVFFCVLSSVPPVFREFHGFSSGQIGMVYSAILIATVLGMITTFTQEKIYNAQVAKRSVEARLHMCCVAGVGFPVSMFMYAWFCRPGVHWVLLCLALTIFYWSMFTIYLAVFSYLADCYTVYASSALAGQSMLRNLLGGIFPFFTMKIFERLGYPWSNTIFAGIALLSAPIPFVVFFFGPRIRKRSKLCIHD